MLVFARILHCWFCWYLLTLLIACERGPEPVPDIHPVAPVPANPGLSDSARALFMRLSESYGKATLSGQVDYKEDGHYVAANYIAKTADRRPVIVGLDLLEYSPSRQAFGADPDNLVEDAIKMVQEQGVVLTLSWHWNAPLYLLNDDREPWWRGFYARATEFNLRQALRNPNSREYQALLRDIDAIAVPLKRLADADIPVLWRPLHAAEGGWFWWGAKGPEAFKDLWRLMFVRMTDLHGLDNLIWVLTSEDEDWYPGDDVVDIIGVDAYPSEQTSLLREHWIPLLKRHNGRKMIALTEFGGVPLIEEMQQEGILFSYFVSWTDKNRGKLGPMNVPVELLQRVYQSPAVITLDEWHDSSKEPTAGGVAPLEVPVIAPEEAEPETAEPQKP
jgi:mannan endo-1,4-beta-mannosidase